ncbi:FAD-dependent oxidoreductase [Dictyobacter alpinus]|uniref:FAD-dependent oxidoreductase n=1 Tax=Dictyobacter alpinus TaxID=2014873 RepID=A0A402BAE8_9CHLR|nr:FAD-dependent monooxygenase [Dictyobacter alpinus]GCE28334.1 FAD-dependent oxidoreductase [Dictyobacter alpinus]
MNSNKITKNKNILISGASVAGPALAYWLSQYGFNPTVVELSSELRKGGYKVDIRGVAVEVAERMGIMQDIRNASTNMKTSTFVDGKSKPLATVSANFLEGRAEKDDEIMRGDLAHILYERTQSAVEYLFGDSIAAMEQDDDGVTVTFESGTTRTFDLVIGADGLHSNVRRQAFGDESQFIHHLGAYISIFSTPNFLHLDHQELYYNSPKKLTCIYSARENTQARALFIFNAPPLSYNHRDSEQQKQILTSTFADTGWQTPRLLEMAQEASDFYFDSMSLIQMEHWSTGRTALLGDAAYCASPASGQGTSMALVGAYVLAGELAEAGGDYHTAFARYESAMRSYVEANQQFALRAIKGFTPRTSAHLWFQNQMLRLFTFLPLEGLILGQIVKAMEKISTTITLKDYHTCEQVQHLGA